MVKNIAGGKYKLGNVIAAGSFGKVYEDAPFAIKEVQLPCRLSKNKALTAIITNQIRILTQLNHDNTVKLFQIVEQVGFIYIVMQLCDGDLRRYTECGPIGQHMACKYLKQILCGYKELSRLKIVHRDLKPANILLKDSCLKIADFGMSRLQEAGELLRSHVGTPYYMAPQVLQRIDYTSKCDVWSMGVIFYELIFGHLPWMGKTEEHLLTTIMTQPLSFPLPVSQPVKEILQGMLAISEGRRLTCSDIEKLLMFIEKTQNGKDQKSFHWSVVKELVANEAENQARMRYKLAFGELNKDQKKEIKNQLICLFREEDVYLLDYLAI